MADVWVTYQPADDCQCWRDGVCSHGWTWQEDDCNHRDAMIDDVHESVADAVRALFSVYGASAIGRLIRQRYSTSRPRTTMRIFVMPASAHGQLADDHEAYGGPSPLWVIERKKAAPRSRVGDAERRFANGYRVTAATSAADQTDTPSVE